MTEAQTVEEYGRYRLLNRVAVGGMAEIFLATSTSLNGFEKRLVIKRIRTDLTRDEQFSSMFIDEARISIQLTHPNIVQVFDFGRVDDTYYLAMEFVHGCDVAAITELEVVQEARLDPGLALYIAGEALQGLDYAHELVDVAGHPLKVVHRDISPANLMLGYNGSVKVADFGIAEAKGRITQTQPGMVVGKLTYMSPEHANGEGVDHRTDVFSAGTVLWEMLTGTPCYGGVVDESFFDRIRHGQIPSVNSLRSDISPELDALVMKAIAPRAEDRYQSAKDFAEAARLYRVTNFPEVSSYSLQAFLKENRQELGEIQEDHIQEELESLPPTRPQSLPDESTTTLPLAPQDSGFDWSPELINAIEGFRSDPSLWTIVTMGEICERESQTEAANIFWRVAAVKFARAGLLAQAVHCCKALLKSRPVSEVQPFAARLPELSAAAPQDVNALLWVNDGPVETLLQELFAEGDLQTGASTRHSPLLSFLGSPAFAELVVGAKSLHIGPNQAVIKQDDRGQSMYLITRGRVIVYTRGQEGQRLYLSSLTAGDFFGENGFFTDTPRSATIESLNDVELIEIDPEFLEQVMATNVDAGEVLLAFYKERIVETLMARSEVFGVLPVDTRRATVDYFKLRTFGAGELVIEEGALNNQIYLIKSGDAEVFTEKGGPRTVLSTIGSGSILGEVAAIRGIPRTASVLAKSHLETLELDGEVFKSLLEARPEVKTRVLDVVAQRARENMDRVMGPSPFAKNLPQPS